MKIICAGLQKTGTKSLAEALRILGYNVHDVFEQVIYDKKLWNKVLDNEATTTDYQKVLCDVDAVMDWPAVAVWEQMSEAFPEAKIILTIRSSEDEWYASMKNQFETTNQYIPRNKILQQIVPWLLGPLRLEFVRMESAFVPVCLGVPRMAGKPVESFLRSRYRQHNCYVKSVCESGNLLIYNVKEGWDPLCKFLNMEIPDEPFPKTNVKAAIVHEVASNKWKYDGGYYETVRKQSFARLRTIVICFLAILSFIFYSWNF